jgi:DNA mismatch repair protein MutS
MMEQFFALKREAGDALLFYRMGDFFELFFEDAKVAARVLDIALTSRGEHEGEPVPMCGVPVHSAESYLARLIKGGCRVAIAEQTETPEEAKVRAKAEGRGSKALVARDIVRFVTAGTLTEEALLDPKSSNCLVAIAPLRGAIGLASCDISTGRMVLEECAPDALEAAIARLGPSELIVPDEWPEGLGGDMGGKLDGELVGATIDAESRPKAHFRSEDGEAQLKSIHSIATLDGLGDFSRAMLAAAAGLIAYLEHAGRGTLPFLLPPALRRSDAHMAMDAATRASLEITEAQNGGTRANSLLGGLDRCSTGAGSRQLAEDLSAPLADKARIEARHAGLRHFHADPILRADVRAQLRSCPDIGRALGRLVAGRGTPRDLGQIRDGLAEAARIRDTLLTSPDLPPLLVQQIAALDGHADQIALLARALVASPPTERSAGGFIAEGYDASLDALRETSGNARRAIAMLESRYRDETEVASLKIKHNKVLGYFIEVPAKHGDGLMAPDSGFTHRQTMAGAVRFNSVSLHEEASRIAQAGAHAIAAEEAHFEELSEAIIDAREAIALSAAALARIDICAGLAERASEGDWCEPEMREEAELAIEGGRHPVVEEALARSGERFVANDCKLSQSDRLWLIGGPNMGGKSTFLRQNALIILLAQAGSFVPATSAVIGIADRLFSRVGASDNLAQGRSTFMVEMVETAAILSQATPRSFVILDEVGRGTSTYDGMALAWAIVEAVHERLACRCLFATHYHELARLAETCPALSLHHVRAREWKGDLVLLHELAKGAADRSYGLAVARLAGVPAPVLKRAKTVLTRLEKARDETGGMAAGLGELPLFASKAEEPEENEDAALYEAVSKLDIDALSPREALETLYRLQREALEARA